MPGIGSKSTRGLGAVALVALGAASTVVFSGGVTPHAAAVVEAELPLEPLPSADLTALDDGHQHFVVRLPDAPAASATPSPADSDTAAGSAVTIDDGGEVILSRSDDGSLPVLDLADLALLGDRVERLEGDGSELVAVLADGTRLSVAAGAATSNPTVDAPVVDGGPAALLSHPDVLSVESVGGDWYRVTTDLRAAEFEALAAEFGVDATEDAPMTVASDDQYAGLLWGLENNGDRSFRGVVGAEDFDVDGVEGRAYVRGAGVVVAVIDSGAVEDHPDLPRFWTNDDEDCDNGVDDDANGYVDDCRGWDFFNSDNSPDDRTTDNNHGTHVTGTIAAIADNGIGVAGLAPDATIMNIKALQSGSTRTSIAAEAIRYAVDNGADVINASFGTTNATLAQVALLAESVAYAEQHGVIVVAASGNAGQDTDRNPSYPAALPNDNVISVGAAQADGRPASFSNFGTESVDLFAPGHYIASTSGRRTYSAMQGTSMASPHVAAGVALLLSAEPALSVADVRARLLSTTDRSPAFAGTSATSGMMNVATMLGIGEGDVSTPALDVVVAGMDGLVADQEGAVAVRTTILDPTIAGTQDVVLRATVLTAIDGIDYGVVNLPISVDGRELVTDDFAQVILTDPAPADDPSFTDGVTSVLDTALPAGVYALVIEVVDADDPDAAYGPAAVVFTQIPEVADEPEPEEPTTDEPGQDEPGDEPAGDGPLTTAPPTSTPSGGDEPGDAEPSPETTTTTAPDAGGDQPTPDTSTTTAPADNGGGNDGGGTKATTTTTAPANNGGGNSGGGTKATTTTTAPANNGGGNSGGGTKATTTTTAPANNGGGNDGGGGTKATTTTTTTTTTTAPPQNDDPSMPGEPDPVKLGKILFSKVSPTWGPSSGGKTVVLHGRNFPSYVQVLIGGEYARVTNVHKNSIIVETPPHAPGIYDVTIVVRGGQLTLGQAYAYADKKPTDRPETGGPDEIDTPTTKPKSEKTKSVKKPKSTKGDNDIPSAPGIGDGPDDDRSGDGAPTTTTTTTTTTPTDPDRTDRDRTDPGGPDAEPAPTGRPRLTLAPSGTSFFGGSARHEVMSGSPIGIAPADWASRSCRSASCPAVLFD